MRPYYYSGTCSSFFFKSRKMYQMFIYWGKSTFSTSFIPFKNVCKCRIWLKKYKIFLGERGITLQPLQRPSSFSPGLLLFNLGQQSQNFSSPVGYYAQKVNLGPCTVQQLLRDTAITCSSCKAKYQTKSKLKVWSENIKNALTEMEKTICIMGASCKTKK